MVEETNGKLSYNEALEIEAFVTNNPERALQIIYGSCTGVAS